MSTVAFIRRCLAVGMDMDMALLAAEQFEAATPPLLIDVQAERRRAKDRDRKAAKAAGIPQNSAESAEAAEDAETPPLPLPSSPQTPQQPTPTPPDINTRTRGPKFAKSNGFARFWEAYPNKVGKAAAEKAYARAIAKIAGPDPPGVLLAGVERAKASREWSEGYIPHPTTWLNQGRWEDEPAEIIPIQAKPHERPHHDAKYASRQDNLSRALAGADSAAGRQRWEP